MELSTQNRFDSRLVAVSLLVSLLGASGATKFLVAMDSSPDTPAANMFPAAARANRSVFYDKSSESRSLGEVHRLFQKKIEKI